MRAIRRRRSASSYGKLLLVIPLPGKPGAALQSFDAAPNPSTLPTSGGQYDVSFAITMPSGVSQLLAAPADTYTLMPFERLSLNTVTIAVEENNG